MRNRILSSIFPLWTSATAKHSLRRDWPESRIPAFALGSTSQEQNEHRLKHFNTTEGSQRAAHRHHARRYPSPCRFPAASIRCANCLRQFVRVGVCNAVQEQHGARRRLCIQVSIPPADSSDPLFAAFDEHTRYVSAFVDSAVFASMGWSMRWRWVFVQRRRSSAFHRQLDRDQGCPPMHRCLWRHIPQMACLRRVIDAASYWCRLRLILITRTQEALLLFRICADVHALPQSRRQHDNPSGERSKWHKLT